MSFSSYKKQIRAIAIALIFSFFTSVATAAPAAPAVRAPGKPAAQPATPSQTSQPATVPPQTSQPATTTSNPVQTTTQTVSSKPATTQSTPVTTKPTVTASPAAKTKTETAKPASTQKQSSTAVVPGHPFRIQNKEENYNSLLSKTATRKLDAALGNMIGGYGEKVPGLAVIVYKNGKEVYRNMLGNRFLSPRNKTGTCPSQRTAASGSHPSPRFLRQQDICSWQNRVKLT